MACAHSARALQSSRQALHLPLPTAAHTLLPSVLLVCISGLCCCIAIHAGAQRQGRLPQCAFCPAANPHQNQPQRPQCANDSDRCSNSNRSSGNQAAIKWLALGAVQRPRQCHSGQARRNGDRPKARRTAPLQSARPRRGCARTARPHRPRPH